jgi:hypothetical protein
MFLGIRFIKMYFVHFKKTSVFPGATQCDDHKQKRGRETKRVFLGKLTFPLIKMSFSAEEESGSGKTARHSPS